MSVQSLISLPGNLQLKIFPESSFTKTATGTRLRKKVRFECDEPKKSFETIPLENPAISAPKCTNEEIQSEKVQVVQVKLLSNIQPETIPILIPVKHNKTNTNDTKVCELSKDATKVRNNAPMRISTDRPLNVRIMLHAARDNQHMSSSRLRKVKPPTDHATCFYS